MHGSTRAARFRLWPWPAALPRRCAAQVVTRLHQAGRRGGPQMKESTSRDKRGCRRSVTESPIKVSAVALRIEILARRRKSGQERVSRLPHRVRRARSSSGESVIGRHHRGINLPALAPARLSTSRSRAERPGASPDGCTSCTDASAGGSLLRPARQLFGNPQVQQADQPGHRKRGPSKQSSRH